MSLFAPPTDVELASVRASWRDRDLSPRAVEVLDTRLLPDGYPTVGRENFHPQEMATRAARVGAVRTFQLNLR